MKPPEGSEEPAAAPAMVFALGVAALVVVLFGLVADPVLRLAQAASALAL
jgi:hypothetical protein